MHVLRMDADLDVALTLYLAGINSYLAPYLAFDSVRPPISTHSVAFRAVKVFFT
jgi:hypothetical protein